MRYLVIGICILVLLLGLSLLVSWYSCSCIDETAAQLREIAAYFPAEDFDSILPALTDAQDDWEARHGFFSSILSHTELEEVGYCFAGMIAYAEQGEMAELRDAHARLLAMLDHLRVVDLPYYYNILTAIVNLPDRAG